MPNSTATDIAEFLLAVNPQFLSTNHRSNHAVIAVGVEPEVQNKVIVTLYDTGGPPSNPAYQRDEPRIQVRVKGSSEFNYNSAYNMQQKIKDILLGMDRVVIGGTLYVGVWQQTDIANLASDYNNRPILVANYRTVRQYDTPNRLPIE